MGKLATLVVLTVVFTDSFVAAQSTIRVSVNSSGAQGNAGSVEAVTSGDGRFTAFRSSATTFVTDMNNSTDVFRRDNVTQQTVLVSVNTTGVPASGDSYQPAITVNGRFVAFESAAPDLVANDTNAAYDVFLRDMVLGTTELISQSSSGVQGDYSSWQPEVSNDGRYVAFISFATTLVAGDTNSTTDVFLRDRTLQTTIRVNVSSAGVQANGVSGLGKGSTGISGNGRYVSFTSSATNLIAIDTNGATVDIFVRDLLLQTTTIASLDSYGNEGNSWSGRHSLSYDGRFLAFVSNATNLVANDTNTRADIFVRDRTFSLTSRTSLSSEGGETDSDSDDPSISLDGRYVAFDSYATNLVPAMPFQKCIYVRDRATGLTSLESTNTSGNPPNGLCQNASISMDGRRIVYESTASDLVPGDTNNQLDAFQRDRGALPQYVSYCFGDGFSSSCPCANECQYGLQEGCKHALGYGGKLTAEGLADTTNDSFVLVGSQLTNSAALYFQGTSDVNGGNGIPFGDGLLCIGGTIIRLGVKFAVLGTSRYPEMNDPPISVAGAVSFGTFRHYQAWYRDSIPFCTMATYNLTNALLVLWLPCPMCP